MLTFAENPYTNLQSILLFHQLRRHGRDQEGQSLPGARGAQSPLRPESPWMGDGFTGK